MSIFQGFKEVWEPIKLNNTVQQYTDFKLRKQFLMESKNTEKAFFGLLPFVWETNFVRCDFVFEFILSDLQKKLFLKF